MSSFHARFRTFLVCSLLATGTMASAETYYIDADGGRDGYPGTSAEQAWATLDRASAQVFQPGDRILLQAGDSFPGTLRFDGTGGAEDAPIQVEAYGEGDPPVINTSGYLAGVHIRNAAHIEVRKLEIVGNGGAMVDGSPEAERFGVLVDGTGNGTFRSIVLEQLYLHDIYPHIGSDHEGRNPTTHLGYGVALRGTQAVPASDIRVEGCRIERAGFKAIEMKNLGGAEILGNQMKDIGGPAIQSSRVTDLVVRGNVVDGSGSFVDPRMHGRGSGIWPWSSERVLIEQNTFMHARGKADSCGMHIDFNCRDVVVQYNLSVDNEGGFIEVLGNNHNCTYRYNISVDDGARVKGENGAHQDGHVIWISGFVGSSRPRNGPFNTYIYNNTIYVNSGIRSTFSIQETGDGLLIANNIFHIEGTTVDVTGGSLDDYTQAMIDRVVWTNNLYPGEGIVPDSFPFTDTGPIYGDPGFSDPGGTAPEDYIPWSRSLVTDGGIAVEKLPGDSIGLEIGLAVDRDFFGNPVVGPPDLGAIELGGTPLSLPDAGFAQPPVSPAAGLAEMTSVTGPYNTEYYFTEITGNLGGDDSGWQPDPLYRDDGLLPNTAYTYTVTLRDAADQEGDPSAAATVRTARPAPVQDEVILFEDFSTQPDPANTPEPLPAMTWQLGDGPSWETEAQNSSSDSTGDEALRVGWGFDETVVQWYADRAWDTGRDYLFSGDWLIDNTLDIHAGMVVGLSEIDPDTGAPRQRIKEFTIGELESPAIGQSGSFSLFVSAAELVAAELDPSNRIGVFLHHDDDGVLYSEGPTLRNDVYLVDNLELIGIGADRDGDGIPDEAEPGLGLNPDDGTDGAGDRDGDGSDNYAEFLVGSDLDDPADWFGIVLSADPGDPQVVIPGRFVQPGRLYILEQAIDLDGPGAWIAQDAVNGSAAGPGADHAFAGVPVAPRSYVRVRVEWDPVGDSSPAAPGSS